MLTTLEDLALFVLKDRDGKWIARSQIALGGTLRLKIDTHKTTQGNLVTRAQVGREDKGCFTVVIFEDFTRALIVNKVRVTAKVVEDQHARGMAMLTDIMPAIRKQYGAEVIV